MIRIGDSWLDFVIYTDESRFIIGNDGGEYCYCRPGQANLPRNCTRVDKYAKFSIMFWGGIWIGGKTDLIEVNGNMDAALYIEMLDTLVVPEIRQLKGDEHWVFQ